MHAHICFTIGMTVPSHNQQNPSGEFFCGTTIVLVALTVVCIALCIPSSPPVLPDYFDLVKKCQLPTIHHDKQSSIYGSIQKMHTILFCAKKFHARENATLMLKIYCGNWKLSEASSSSNSLEVVVVTHLKSILKVSQMSQEKMLHTITCCWDIISALQEH